MSDAATREERALLRSYARFSAIPAYENPSTEPAATQERPRYVVRPMRSESNGYPVDTDLWAVAELSQRDKYIRRSSSLKLTERAGLYTEWFRMFPLAFAVLERFPADRNGVTIIGNTAILPIRRGSMERVAAGTLEVINLESCDLATSPSDRILLFDTWVLHGDYKWGQCQDPLLPQKYYSCQHHGFGNVLTLKHLGVFWESGDELELYVEPSAPAMDRLMSRLSFNRINKSEKTKTLRLLKYLPNEPLTRHNALQHKLTEEVIRSLETYRSWWPEEWPADKA